MTIKTDTRATLGDFLERVNIEARAERVSRNPHAEGFGDGARHFDVTLTNRSAYCVPPRTMRVYFSQGSAHKKAPTARDVLGCLMMDAGSYASADSFGTWASDYGYDTDSRKAEALYRLIGQQARELEAFLGRKEYLTLINETEGD